ncbi:MAG: hypothetical protein VB118_02845 [Oscillospiraceae bacterium]|nr:hypothetical protein [Oscillospiraceae bacterium]
MKSSFYLGRKYQFNNTFMNNPLDLGGIKLFQIGELCCKPGYENKKLCSEI